MHQIEFANPELFMNYFITHRTLSLGPNKPLIIRNIQSITESAVLNPDLSSFSKIVYPHYFLNRIVLPLGITLYNESPDHPKLHIFENEATFTNDQKTKLIARNGPILTSIGDLVIRMMQTGREVFTIPGGEKLFIADTEDFPYADAERSSIEIDSIYTPFCSLGCTLDWKGKFSSKVFSIDNMNVIELDLTSDFRLDLKGTFEYRNTCDFGRAISALGGFTLPAGKTLKIQAIHDTTFLDLADRNIPPKMWLKLFFDRCLAPYGREVATLKNVETITSRYQNDESVNSTLTITSKEAFVITTKKSSCAFVELNSFARDLVDVDSSEMKKTMATGEKLFFLLRDIPEEKINRIMRYFPPEVIESDEEGKSLCDHIFDTTNIPGVSLVVRGKNVQFGLGKFPHLDLSFISIENLDEMTMTLEPSNPTQFIVDLINGGSDSLREVFFEQDSKIFRYIIFQLFMKIYGGVLSNFPLEELIVLDLKEDVLSKLVGLKDGEEFKKNNELVMGVHLAEMQKICDLGPEELDAISIDSCSPPVQTFLKTINELIGLEMEGSNIFNEYFWPAYKILEKMKKE